MPDEDDSSETDLSEKIAETAQGPAEARGDSSSVKQQPLSELIAADQYLRAKEAQRSKGLGIKLFKLQPPGIQ